MATNIIPTGGWIVTRTLDVSELKSWSELVAGGVVKPFPDGRPLTPEDFGAVPD